MARYLAIDADGPHFAVFSATTGRGGAIQFEKLLTWSMDAPWSPTEGETVGRSLREKLAAAKIPAAPLLVCIGRDRVTFKEVKHPAVPANDEPAVVRFQALKELTEGPDDVVIDYLPRPSEGAERRALVVAARKEIVRAVQVVAQIAGLKLAGIVPRPFALAAAVRHSPTPPATDTAFAVLAVGSTGGEFLVAKGDEILFARPVPGPALNSETALTGEVRRNLAVYGGQNARNPVKSLYIAEGSTVRGFAGRVAASLPITVLSFDPLVGTGLTSEAAPGQLAAAVGLLRLTKGDLPINFVKPREPKAAVDPKRRPILLGLALAATILLAVGVFAWMQLSTKDATIASLRRSVDSLSADLAKLEPDAKRSDEVRKWTDSGVIWLDELYDLAAKFPDLTKLRLTQLTADPIPIPPNAKPNARQYVARVSIEGLTTEDSRALSQLMSELAKEPTYKVEAKNTKMLQFGADRRNFANSFSTRYELERRPIESFSRQFDATAPARRSRGGGRPGGGLLDAILGGAP
jgi:hypothetical protein